MTDLLGQVTPKTMGIIWSTSGEINSQKSFYKEIDYLLNGLLTATLLSAPATAHVLVSSNFGHDFLVLAGHEINPTQLDSFLKLVTPKLSGEQNLLLIEENGSFDKLRSKVPLEVMNHLQPVQ